MRWLSARCGCPLKLLWRRCPGRNRVGFIPGKVSIDANIAQPIERRGRNRCFLSWRLIASSISTGCVWMERNFDPGAAKAQGCKIVSGQCGVPHRPETVMDVSAGGGYIAAAVGVSAPAHQFGLIAGALAVSTAVFGSVGWHTIAGGVCAFFEVGFAGHGSSLLVEANIGDFDAGLPGWGGPGPVQ